MKYLIWDFNGTVINDVDACLDALNAIVAKYLKRPPVTKDEYLHVFTFPVKDYYNKVGFDFKEKSFAEVGKEWVEIYNANHDKYYVNDGVIDLLNEAHQKGYKNILLSASKIEMLKEQVKEIGLYDYFDEILGIDNIYAESKIPIALNFIKDKDPNDCLYLGDSLHDLDVANAMKVKCYLIAQGHQAKDVLVKEHDCVLDSLREVKL